MEWAVAVAAVFLGQLVRGATGFGSALVAVPILAWAWGPVEAVCLAAIIDSLGGLVLVPPVRRQLHIGLIVALYLPLLVGQFIGTELLVTLPEVWVRRVLGAVVFLFGLDTLLRPVRPGRGEWDALPADRRDVYGWASGAGFAGGLMAGLVGAGGPPIVVFMRWFFTDFFGRAQLIGLFLVSSISLAAILTAREAATTETWMRAAVLIVPMAAGALAGTWLAPHVSRQVFGRGVGLLLVLSGLALVAV